MLTSFTQDAPIGVVGAGAMGAGIAEVAATAGHRVTVIDLAEEALKRGRETVAASLAAGIRRGTLTEAAAALISGRISWSESLADLSKARLVIEAIVERNEPKRGLYARLEALLASDAVIASNTSSLSIAELAAGLTYPERFVGLHFFNPAPAMRLVEVVPGPATDAALLEYLRQLMSGWKKIPVVVRDVPGFIVNRVARPYYAEGFLALSEGVAPSDIDKAMKLGGAFRMGPLELADLIGHDVNYGVAESIFLAYGGKTRFRPQSSQKALVDAGHLGRKTSRGVYPAGAIRPASFATETVRPDAIAYNLGSRRAWLRDALDACGLEAMSDPSLPPDSVSVDGHLLSFGDGLSAARRAREDGKTAILLDMARDEENSSLMVAALSPLASPEAAGRFRGLAKALGREALILPDRPGGLVLRILAQLANAAADAVHDGVARAEDIDTALMYGANHPEGPLAWAERVGTGFVRGALANIAGETGDSLYTPSPGFAP